MFDEKSWRYPFCGAKMAWWNLCDTTNGSYCECNTEYLDRSEGCEFCDRGRIDDFVDLEINKPAEYSTCECCGHSKRTSEVTYKIPKDKGHRTNESP